MQFRKSRGMIALAFAGAVLFATASPASAETVEESGFTYYSSNTCESTRSMLRGDGVERVEAEGESLRNNRVIGTSCLEWYEMPVGYKQVRYDLYKWNGSDWAKCYGTGWVENTKKVSNLTVYNTMVAPCGNGYYGSMGLSYHYNNEWYGGQMWSGYTQLGAGSFSANSAATESAAPPRPEWVNSDNSVDVGAVPDTVPAVDSEGSTIGETDVSTAPPKEKPENTVGAGGVSVTDTPTVQQVEAPMRRPRVG
ncbi:hypothetical protein ACFQZ2_05995 [Streptomonospora algeriensis]|uniref:Secreted protein n=1 Tax=Streptomonospora algeriensis TaxID=995084 RepID=A0ABW3BBV0_9ACTN